MTRGLLAAILLALIALSLPAVAQSDPSDEVVEIYERGRQKYADGDIQAALTDYRRATELMGGDPTFEIASNHSNAAFMLGIHDEAATMMRHAIKRLPLSHPDHEALKKKYEDRLAEILAKVGRLAIEVTPAGAEIVVEGKSMGRAPLEDEVFVMPGTREVQAKLDGYEPERKTVTIEAGKRLSVDLLLSPVAAPPTPAEGPEPAVDQGLSSTRLGIGIAGIGLGSGAIIASAILGVTAADRASTVDDLNTSALAAYPQGNACGPGSPALGTSLCTQLEAFHREEITFRNAAIATGVAGAAILGASIIYLALPPSGSDAESAVTMAWSPLGAYVRGSF